MATYVRTQSIEHDIGNDGRLALKVSSGHIDVRGVTGERARLRATFEIRADSDADADRIYDDARLRAERGGGALEVEEPREASGGLGGAVARLLGSRGHVQLRVEAEAPSMAELRLETVSADVTVEGLMGDQRYTTVSGDLFMTGIGGSLRVSSVSGDAVLRADRPVIVRVDTVSGDLSLAAPRLDGLRAHGVSGDIGVEGALAPGGEFQVETVSGDLTVGLAGGATFEVRGLSTDISSDLDHRVEGHHDRRRVIVGGGGPGFVFRSMSGDLAVHGARRATAVGAAQRATVGSWPEAGQGEMQEQMAVLRALERGEIDVDEATRRLAAIERGGAS